MNTNTREMTEIVVCNDLFSSHHQSLAKLHFLTGRRDKFSARVET